MHAYVCMHMYVHVCMCVYVCNYENTTEEKIDDATCVKTLSK